MNIQKNLPDLTPEENIKLENDLLKAKLTAEFGMKGSDTSKLDSEIENQWLNYIYDFENTCKNAGRITIYEFIGKPEFKSLSANQLTPEEIKTELERILEVMNENFIILDVLSDYENEEELIYKFITEEFFPYEIDNIRIEGMNHCFIYEEFHTNHKYDLTNDSEFLLDNIFDSGWNSQFSGIFLADVIEYENKTYSKEDFEKLILGFQNSGKSYELISKEVKEVEFDLEKKVAIVSGDLRYKLGLEHITGEFKFDCIFNEFGYWNITKIILPDEIFFV